jgi:hypothetical protein
VTANTGDGILVDAGSINTLILGNFAVRNTDDGIDIDSPGATVTGNDADRNGDLGIDAVIGVLDGGAAARGSVGPIRNARPPSAAGVSGARRLLCHRCPGRGCCAARTDHFSWSRKARMTVANSGDTPRL